MCVFCQLMDAALVESLYCDSRRHLIEAMKELKMAMDIKELTEMRNQCAKNFIEGKQRHRRMQMLSAAAAARASVQTQIQLPLETMMCTETASFQMQLQLHQHDQHTAVDVTSMQAVQGTTTAISTIPSTDEHEHLDCPVSVSSTMPMSPLITSVPNILMDNEVLIDDGEFAATFAEVVNDSQMAFEFADTVSSTTDCELHIIPAAIIAANNTDLLLDSTDAPLCFTATDPLSIASVALPSDEVVSTTSTSAVLVNELNADIMDPIGTEPMVSLHLLLTFNLENPKCWFFFRGAVALLCVLFSSFLCLSLSNALCDFFF